MQNQLQYYAQQCSDNFYQNYKTDYQFFDIDDFILYLGNTIAGIYQTYFDKQRQEFRSEKKDEVVTFDEGMLSYEDIVLSSANNTLTATLSEPIMSFLTDKSNTGVQTIKILKPQCNCEVERSSLSSEWQLDLIPKVNKVFFRAGNTTVTFTNKSQFNISTATVRIYYVPQMYPCAIIAQGIANEAIAKTVLLMRQMHDKNVVKKSLDNNDNAILETEIDKMAIK